MNPKTTHPARRPSETFAYRGAEWHRKSLGTTGLLYDSDNVVADMDGSTVSRFYVTPMLDENVSMTLVGGAQAGTYFYSQDERQSVRTLTDSTGAIVNRYDYTVFGEPVAVAGSPAPVVQQRYTYTGREVNPYSGSFYFRYRHYATGTGVFTARDPLGYADGPSLYSAFFARWLGIDPKGLALKELPLKDDVALKDALGFTNVLPDSDDSGVSCECKFDWHYVGRKKDRPIDFRFECSFKASIQIQMLYPSADQRWLKATEDKADFYEYLGKKGWEQNKELSEAIRRMNTNEIYEAVLKHEQQHYRLFVNWYKSREAELAKFNVEMRKKGRANKECMSCEQLKIDEGKAVEDFKTKINADYFQFTLWQADRVHGLKSVDDPLPACPMTANQKGK